MRTLVKYEKTQAAIYVSHLDTQRAIQRVLRRANLPIKYTMGFHPHPVLTFAQPLSVGVSSQGEYFEFSMLEYMGPVKLRSLIASHMPKGFLCLDCGYIRDEFPSLMAMVKRSEWEIFLDDVSYDKGVKALDAMLAQDEVFIEKTTKKGTRQVDIRHGIFDVQYKEKDGGIKYFVTLTTGSTGNISPRDFITAMGFDSRYARCHRVDMYYEYQGSYLPLNHSTRAV